MRQKSGLKPVFLTNNNPIEFNQKPWRDFDGKTPECTWLMVIILKIYRIARLPKMIILGLLDLRQYTERG